MWQSQRSDNRTRQWLALVWLAALLTVMLNPWRVYAAGEQAAADRDLHYNEAGFFDIHVCNWPNRPFFFMPLFSTADFSAVRDIEIHYPDGSTLARLDLDRYRTIKRKHKPDKRVFIKRVTIPPAAVNGWYSAHVTLQDGREYTAQDYVILSKLPQASGQVPANDDEVALPDELTWNPVAGAGYYQVFIRDLWNDSTLIYTSELLSEPVLRLPPGLLDAGGYYSWVIHARDTNTHVLLGDFNHGSLSKPATFSVRQ
jgi:hypothetical protein